MNLDDRLGTTAHEATQLFVDDDIPSFKPPRNRGPLVGLALAVVIGIAVVTTAGLRPGTIATPAATTAAAAPSTTVVPSTTTISPTTLNSVVEEPGPVETPPDAFVSALDIEQPVPLRIFTVSVDNLSSGEVAMVDLEKATWTLHPDGLNGGPHRIHGAAMSSKRDLVVWTDQPTGLVFSDSLFNADLEIDLAPRSDLEFANSYQIVPTPSGDALWIVQPGVAYGNVDEPTLIELVELPSLRQVTSFEVDPNSYPIGATDAGLVLNIERLFDTGDGWITEPGSERVAIVDPSGSVSEIGPGRAIATSADTIVRLVCQAEYPDDCQVVIGDGVGAVTLPDSGTWAPVGGPRVPGYTLPLSPVSPDGTLLLIGFGEDLDVNGSPARATLYVVDLSDGSTQEIAFTEGRFPLATWSADGRWVAIIDGQDIIMANVDDPELVFAVEDAIPEGHYPYAAG